MPTSSIHNKAKGKKEAVRYKLHRWIPNVYYIHDSKFGEDLATSKSREEAQLIVDALNSYKKPSPAATIGKE